MILGFMQKFPWKEPTYFREKILAGAKVWTGNNEHYSFTPKIHTIREDKHNRWKPGMSIQMVYRGPKYSILSHFNKGIPEIERCVSVQKVSIGFSHFDKVHYVIIDKRYLSLAQQIDFARNDGFESLEQFFKWFNEDFTGKIIHWTDYRYGLKLFK